jgi:hypothetical protein
MKIAGRYMGDIARKGAMNPYISAAGLGGLTAGAATLGNIVSGEAADEGAGRLGLEALGAGALGAYVGSRIPGNLAQLRGMRRAAATDLRGKGAGRNITVDPSTGQAYQTVGVNPEAAQMREDYLKGSSALNRGFQGGTALSALAAGGIGGMLGGGVANVGQMVGIPGMEQDQMMQLAAQQALDPESYGSSNSPGARYKAPTMQYM